MAGTSMLGSRSFFSARATCGQPAEIGLAQDDADVGMRDEQAALVHHVGRTGLANMDARDDIPDELEVDLRYRDAGGAASCRRSPG